MNTCTIKNLFDTMTTGIQITEDNRYFGKLNGIELEYYDENEKTIKWGNVEFIEKHFVDKPMYEIVLENGDFVEVTEDHSLMVLRNGKLIESKVYELESNDIFITMNGQTSYKEIIPLERCARWVYDIQMEDNPHTFFANGILVHNSQFVRREVDSETIKKLNDEMNDYKLKEELIKKYNHGLVDKYFQYNLEHEQTLEWIYFGERKKRYYGIRADGSKYIHGLNIIRKDTPELIKNILDEICEKAVKGLLIYQDFNDVYDKMKNADYSGIGVHKSFSKPFEYYNKTIPQHVSGALYANEYFDCQLKSSDVTFLFYINSFCQPEIKLKDRKNVICLRESDFEIIDNTDKFEIDYVELMEKQVIQPLREFDKIPIVNELIEKWAQEHPENYRFSKVKGYVFKKKKI